jgi:hypothetical protein
MNKATSNDYIRVGPPTPSATDLFGTTEVDEDRRDFRNTSTTAWRRIQPAHLIGTYLLYIDYKEHLYSTITTDNFTLQLPREKKDIDTTTIQ